jgi:hypothetical protein
MRANHDALSVLLGEVRPNWRRLADAVARMGLADETAASRHERHFE